MTLRRAAALLLTLLLAGACSDSTGSDNGEPRPGTFRGGLSGDITEPVSQGPARVVGGTAPGAPATIYLVDDRVPGQARQLLLRWPAGLAPGSYDLRQLGSQASGTFVGTRFDVIDAATGEASVSLASIGAGTVTIHEVTPEIVRGSYDAINLGSNAAGQQMMVRAIGLFAATRQPID
jgi:hypothetical protein